jgi:hypothetical protein
MEDEDDHVDGSVGLGTTGDGLLTGESFGYVFEVKLVLPDGDGPLLLLMLPQLVLLESACVGIWSVQVVPSKVPCSLALTEYVTIDAGLGAFDNGLSLGFGLGLGLGCALGFSVGLVDPPATLTPLLDDGLGVSCGLPVPGNGTSPLLLMVLVLVLD